VDVGHAEACGVELDEDVVWPWDGDRDGTNFLDIGLGRRGVGGREWGVEYDVEVGTFIYDYSRLTFFGDDEALNFFRNCRCRRLDGSCL
jgi:hypothetical protein